MSSPLALLCIPKLEAGWKLFPRRVGGNLVE